MTAKLPIWFQSLTIVCLCGVWMAVVAWVEVNERALDKLSMFDRVWERRWYSFGRYYFGNGVSSLVCGYLPLAILFLGFRFAWAGTGRILYPVALCPVVLMALVMMIGMMRMR